MWGYNILTFRWGFTYDDGGAVFDVVIITPVYTMCLENFEEKKENFETQPDEG